MFRSFFLFYNPPVDFRLVRKFRFAKQMRYNSGHPYMEYHVGWAVFRRFYV
jgi:hypothetical protein